jgi:hypothetical protein
LSRLSRRFQRRAAEDIFRQRDQRRYEMPQAMPPAMPRLRADISPDGFASAAADRPSFQLRAMLLSPSFGATSYFFSPIAAAAASFRCRR